MAKEYQKGLKKLMKIINLNQVLNQMKNFIYLKKEAKISNCTETINLLKKLIK